MTDKTIRKISRELNRGAYLRSSSIVLSAIIICAVFSVITFSLVRLAELSGLKQLSGTYGRFIYPSVLSVVFLIFVFIELVLLSSVSIGEKAWYTGRLTRKKQCGKRLRFWFSPSRSFKAFRLNLLIFVLKLMWTAAFISPSALFFSVVFLTAFSGGIELYLLIALLSGGVLLLATGLIFRFFIVQRYFLAPYILADNPRLSATQAVMQSKTLSDGQILRIAGFKLKFLPAFFTYPLIIPAVFLHPHYKQSCSVIAKELCIC